MPASAFIPKRYLIKTPNRKISRRIKGALLKSRRLGSMVSICGDKTKNKVKAALSNRPIPSRRMPYTATAHTPSSIAHSNSRLVQEMPRIRQNRATV
ncbi:MAG: hypothetical protein BWX80_02436 [Candidatus Hydrogenedentes bacterium ADurb.Bin101]|nr:MAG: hypothetical protein BWX80_02436 [Candidatus Hydrogenedentes bacterium ADurb.Bin101]